MKEITSTLFLALCFYYSTAAQPSFNWATKFGSNDQVFQVSTIKSDKVGNSYVLARFRGTLVFPNGAVSSLGISTGVLLAKYNSQGSALWGNLIGNVNSGAPSASIMSYMDMVIDSVGNPYVSINGTFAGVTNPGNTYSNVGKFDTSGTLMWFKSLTGVTGSINPVASCLALNSQESELILAFGNFANASMDFGDNHVVAFNAVTIARYNTASGLTLSANSAVGITRAAEKITSTADGSLYLLYNNSCPACQNNFAIAQFNPADSMLWQVSTTAVNDNFRDIASYGNDIYAIGNFHSGTVQLDTLLATSNYTSDFFITKIKSWGQVEFVKAGSTGASGSAYADRIGIDRNKGLYVLGGATSGTSVTNQSYVINSPNEHFILRYDSSVNFLWGKQFNTNLTTGDYTVDRPSFDINASLDIYTSGVYNPHAHFETDSLLNNFSSRDGFVFKLGQCSSSPATITANSAIVFCQGGSVILTSSTGQNYHWSNNAISQAITVSTSGTYFVTVSDNLGCVSSSQPITITVHSNPPMPVITAVGFTLVSNASADNQWYRNNSILTGQTGNTFTATQDGCYSVSVTDSNSCSSISDTVCLQTTDIKGIESNSFFSVYPNPAIDKLYIEAKDLTIGEINIYNSAGKIVSQTKLPQNRYVDIRRLTPGVYIIEIKTQEVTVRRKWIKL